MLNLTRYRVDVFDIAGTPVAAFSEDANGEFVKFDDIKEFLKPSHNTGSLKLPPDIKEKFSKFVAEQKDIPPEFAQVVDDNFWDLV